MQLKSLSATAIDVYEGCPARYRAIYSGERVQEVASAAADIGSAVHEALELGVRDGVPVPIERLLAYYDAAYWKLFTDRSMYSDGILMLRRWHDRQDWHDREVVLTEVKETFPIKTSDGDKPVTYIFDRCDKVHNEDGTFDIEVVDYKTYRSRVSPDDMRHRIQPRLYSVAARIRFPEARRIWVTYDLLRHEPVSVAFARDDDVVTFKYLKAVAERILADTEAFERINPDCRWCLRRNVCTALRRHVDAGGVLARQDPQEAARTRREVADQIKGLEAILKDCDDFLLDYMRRNDTLKLELDDTIVEASARTTRVVDAERAAAIVGPELFARIGKLTMGAVDELLKGNELTDDQKYELKRLIRREYGAEFIKTKSKPAVVK